MGFVRCLVAAVAALCWAFSTGTPGAVASEPVRVVTGDDYIPFTDQQLPRQGFATAVVRAAFERAGLRVDMTWRPWKRGYADTAQVLFDATFPYFKTLERQQEMHYSSPIYEVPTKLFYRRGGPSMESYEDLMGLTVCNPLGYAIPPELGRLIAAGAVQRDQPRDMVHCFRKLIAGRVDVVPTNELQGWDLVRRLGDGEGQAIAASHFDVVVNTLHLIVSRSHPEGAALIKRFDDGLRSLREDGTLARLEAELLATYLSAER